jgi:hypothetical protein
MRLNVWSMYLQMHTRFCNPISVLGHGFYVTRPGSQGHDSPGSLLRGSAMFSAAGMADEGNSQRQKIDSKSSRVKLLTYYYILFIKYLYQFKIMKLNTIQWRHVVA